MAEHPDIRACDTELRASDFWDPFACQPRVFLCSCGRRWVHVCDEAEGCFYTEAGDGDTP